MTNQVMEKASAICGAIARQYNGPPASHQQNPCHEIGEGAVFPKTGILQKGNSSGSEEEPGT